MITEIPTPDDFAGSGLSLLNLAWSICMDLIRDLAEAELELWDPDGEAANQYWKESQPALANALALVQQSQEMALKGKIAAVSPYLLISRDPREWPRRCDLQDVSFSNFRTADAVDLVTIHNTVHPKESRLSKEFATFYGEIRRKRNAIIHAGGAGQTIEVGELLLSVLRTNEHLYPQLRWMKRRNDYLEFDRIAVAYSSDHVTTVLLKEFDTINRLLTPANRKLYLGLTKARRYLCPRCYRTAERLDPVLIPTAQLKPNSPQAREVLCLVCGDTAPVSRASCTDVHCSSNVICNEESWGSLCLVCAAE